ncbi:hypothetical protein [Brasilonema sp. UFV-L1]|uniref:hypothetical protein n=1 Tax=Brasilonema sp. UFV-L1 TaxID=2234130 RepID=UPI00145E5F3E|nr:hypothetical protein [Brasilonema sp. UFV-L1]NMG08705.1 hypothetical protein [Brasilonema sp. UFV-L1]
MAIIKISELRPAGSELFQDSESYLNELNEQEVSMAIGGEGGSDVTSSVISINSQTVSLQTQSVITQVKTDVTKNVTW